MSPLPQVLRSDARDNRQRVLDAARELFASEGLDTPVRRIAHQAGLSPATVYRHFPTRQILATEALAGQLGACRRIIDRGSAEPDPWRGLCLILQQVCELHARGQSVTTAFMSAFPRAMDFAADRRHALTSVADLARRARDIGALRPDVVLDDLIVLLTANRGIRAASPAATVAASRRFATLAIQALQSPGWPGAIDPAGFA
jgi:AcrR family transcriptional regulator